MTKRTTRRFSPENKEQCVERGVTSGQLKSWHLELLAVGSASALAQSKAKAAELAQLRRDEKRVKGENEVIRVGESAKGATGSSPPANAFFDQ